MGEKFEGDAVKARNCPDAERAASCNPTLGFDPQRISVYFVVSLQHFVLQVDVIINYLHAKDSITYLPTILCMNSAQVLNGIASKFNIILFNFEFHQSFIPVTWWLSFVLCSVNDPLIVNKIMNLRVSC